MHGTCRFSLGGSPGEASWDYDGCALTVTPTGGSSLAFVVKELCGLSGDDYSVTVHVPGTGGTQELTLSHLGHDGPTLAEALRRDWLDARTRALRLTGSGEPWSVLGSMSESLEATGAPDASTGQPGPAQPFHAQLFEDLMVVAREGRDLEPLFLSLVEDASFDEATYTIHVHEWPGRTLLLSRLAKQTDEFLRRLGAARLVLSKESASTLATALPGLPAQARTTLAASWMPGRLMELQRMESLCPGLQEALRGTWLAAALRREEVLHLLDAAVASDVWLGCTREGAAPADSGDGEGEVRAAVLPLWVLARVNDVWFLEPASIEDHATYCFEGGDEMPALVSRLLCAPQFSKEALYSPLSELTGDKATLAIPAAHLDFLVQLRARFSGRIIHQSVEAWKSEVERKARG